jgi:hypothetical protein
MKNKQQGTTQLPPSKSGESLTGQAAARDELRQLNLLAHLSSAARDMNSRDAWRLELEYESRRKRMSERLGFDVRVRVKTDALGAVTEEQVADIANELDRGALSEASIRLTMLRDKHRFFMKAGEQVRAARLQSGITKCEQRVDLLVERLSNRLWRQRLQGPDRVETGGTGADGTVLCARPGCGELLPKGRADRKFHSDACKQKDYRDRKNQADTR